MELLTAPLCNTVSSDVGDGLRERRHEFGGRPRHCHRSGPPGSLLVGSLRRPWAGGYFAAPRSRSAHDGEGSTQEGLFGSRAGRGAANALSTRDECDERLPVCQCRSGHWPPVTLTSAPRNAPRQPVR